LQQYLKYLLVGTVSSCIGILLSWWLFIFVLKGDIRGVTQETMLLLNKSKSEIPSEKLPIVKSLIDDGVLLSTGDLLDHIASFYSTVIVILVALLTLVTAINLLIVRSSAEDKAESKAKEVSKIAIGEKLDPKLELINERLSHFSDEELRKKLNLLLETKLFDSLEFWEKINNSIYSKSEESLEDFQSQLEDILSLVKLHGQSLEANNEAIREISKKLEDLDNKESELVNLELFET